MAKYRDLDTATITATTANGTTLSSVKRAVIQKGLNLEQQHILGCFSGFRSNHFTSDTSYRHDLFNIQPYGKSMGRRYHTLTLKQPGTIQQVDCGHLGIYEIIRLDGEEPLVLRYYSTHIVQPHRKRVRDQAAMASGVDASHLAMTLAADLVDQLKGCA